MDTDALVSEALSAVSGSDTPEQLDEARVTWAEFSAALTAIAKSELLDPEGPDQPFEPFATHRLLRRFRRR